MFDMSCMCGNCCRWTCLVWIDIFDNDSLNLTIGLFGASLLSVRHHVFCQRVNCVLPQCPVRTWLRWGACNDRKLAFIFISISSDEMILRNYIVFLGNDANQGIKLSNLEAGNKCHLDLGKFIYNCFRTCCAPYKDKH